MADDIVKRLRTPEFSFYDAKRTNPLPIDSMRLEAAAEIERLRAAGDAMAEWLCLDVAHYEECATMHSDWPEMCDCGADKLRRAWEEARRG